MSAVCLRYANVYGPRQNPEGEAGVVALYFDKMLRGQSPLIYGDGLQTRDFVFVDDVARANLLALAADLPHSFVAINIGTSVATTIRTVEQTIRKHVTERANFSIPPAVWLNERPGELKANCVAIERARQLLDWEPLVDFDAGISRMAQWHSNSFNNLRAKEAVRNDEPQSSLVTVT